MNNRIIVIGATGGTGKQVVEQALQAGYEVTALARKPEAFTLQHPNLKALQGDVTQPATFQHAMEGMSAVISCVGISKARPTTLYSESMHHIVTAMQQSNVRRILCISSGAIDIPPHSSFIMTFLLKNVLQRIYKPVYADMRRMENTLKASKLHWTVVRAPKLTDGKRTGAYRIVTQQPLRKIPTISRADLAGYIVKHISDETTYQSTIEVAY